MTTLNFDEDELHLESNTEVTFSIIGWRRWLPSSCVILAHAFTNMAPISLSLECPCLPTSDKYGSSDSRPCVQRKFINAYKLSIHHKFSDMTSRWLQSVVTVQGWYSKAFMFQKQLISPHRKLNYFVTRRHNRTQNYVQNLLIPGNFRGLLSLFKNLPI